MNLSLERKSILVTGASGGIGETIVRQLLEDDAKVIMVARNEEKMKKIAGLCPSNALVIPFDLHNTEKISSIFETCKERGIKLDGLVHAAGICNNIPIKAVSLQDMEENMKINYYSFVELVRNFANRRYSKDGSSVVGISSIASLMCDAGMSQYAASKAAMNAVTKTMSKEYVRRRIRVNTIAPAFVDTKMAWGTSAQVENFEEYMNGIQPFGIIPTEQIAGLVEFLLSDMALYITGETIPVSAGMQHN